MMRCPDARKPVVASLPSHGTIDHVTEPGPGGCRSVAPPRSLASRRVRGHGGSGERAVERRRSGVATPGARLRGPAAHGRGRPLPRVVPPRRGPPAGAPACTHGPDPAPPGLDVRGDRPLPIHHRERANGTIGGSPSPARSHASRTPARRRDRRLGPRALRARRGPDGAIFVGSKGGPLRPQVWQAEWDRARRSQGSITSTSTTSAMSPAPWPPLPAPAPRS